MKYIIIGKTHNLQGEPCLVWDGMTDRQSGLHSDAAKTFIETFRNAFESIMSALPSGLYRCSYLEYSNNTDIETAISDSNNNKWILDEECFDFDSPSLLLVPADCGLQHSTAHHNMKIVSCSETEFCDAQFISNLMTECFTK